MRDDERDLLDVLKSELDFLEKGGYGRSPRAPWKPQFVFEDSPTCMNYDSKDHPVPCSECVLMQLVPAEFRAAEIPCRHIPFNAEGETLDSLYRYADQYETEEIFGKWLRATIATLEEERRAHRDKGNELPVSDSAGSKGEPLFHNLNPKCANPACPTVFHWLAGGRFFRFQPASATQDPMVQGSFAPTGNHAATHYWLCERCSHVLTLVHDENQGVVVKFLWPEFPGEKSPTQLTAA
ncbi:MAG: hypothetical protein WBF06_04115 [Candidatus Acidiferrales bacterium]